MPEQTDTTLADAVRRWFAAWKPKHLEPLSAWSAKHARLDDNSSYTAFPFQNGWADAMSDPAIPQVTVRKSSRVGYSQTVKNLLGWAHDQQPVNIIVYFPTIRDAEKFSRKEVTRVHSWPAVQAVVRYTTRDPRNTLRQKSFPGGTMLLNGTNAEGEFRADTADWVILEEVDGYKADDAVQRAFKRTQTSDEPKKIAGSTPRIASTSKIEPLFKQGTQEYRHVPCPHCRLMQKLVFGSGGRGPGLKWAPKDRPERVWYECEAGCTIKEHHKAAMDAAGEWIAQAPQNWPHRSFHIWEAYSQFPGASWLSIATRFMEAQGNAADLEVFVNETLGETFEVRGEAPPWRRLYDRREQWPANKVPHGVLLLLGGIDVQKDRVELFVWGWGLDNQCWLVDHIIIPTSPFQPETWLALTAAVQQTWRHEGGAEMRMLRIGCDTGFATMQVEAWCRRHPGYVIPLKGASSIGSPAFAWSGSRDTSPTGKRRRGFRLGMVGGHVLTMELYGALGLDPPTKEDQAQGVLHPRGYVHLGQVATEEVCKQLVGDQWMEARGEWKQVHATEALDGWKYARAMCAAVGLDRWPPARWRALAEQLRGIEGEKPGDAATEAEPEPSASGTSPPAPPLSSRAPPTSRPAAPTPRVGRSSYLSRVGR